jgi:transposase
MRVAAMEFGQGSTTEKTETCTAHAGDGGSGRTACSEIAATTRRRFAAVSGLATSCPCCHVRRTARGSGPGRWRWVVERTFAWLHNLRRLRIRYERDDQLHLAFMLLGCAVVCQRRLGAP